MDTDPAFIVAIQHPGFYGTGDEEIKCTTPEGVGRLIEDRTGISAETVAADLIEDGEYEHTDPETGCEFSARVLAGALV